MPGCSSTRATVTRPVLPNPYLRDILHSAVFLRESAVFLREGPLVQSLFLFSLTARHLCLLYFYLCDRATTPVRSSCEEDTLARLVAFLFGERIYSFPGSCVLSSWPSA